MKNFLWLLFLPCIASAQTDQIPQEQLFLRGHTSLIISPVVGFPYEYEKFGKGEFNFKMASGLQIGVKHAVNFNPRWALEGGFLFGMNIFHFNYEINPPTANVDGSNRGSSTEINPFIEIPYHVIRRFDIANGNYLFAQAGISIHSYSPAGVHSGSGHSYIDSTYNTYLETWQEYAPNPAISGGLTLGAGILTSNKNGNMKRLALIACLDGKNVVEGRYRFYENHERVGGGKFIYHGTYIGLEFGYVFTRMAK